MKYIVETETKSYEFSSMDKALEKAEKLKNSTVTAWEKSGAYRSRQQIYPVRSESFAWHV